MSLLSVSRLWYCSSWHQQMSVFLHYCAYMHVQICKLTFSPNNNLIYSHYSTSCASPSPLFLKRSQALKAHPSFPVSSASASPLPSQTSQELVLDIHTLRVALGQGEWERLSVRLRSELLYWSVRSVSLWGSFSVGFEALGSPLTCWMSLWKRRWAPTSMDGGLLKGFSWWRKNILYCLCPPPPPPSPFLFVFL